MYLGYLVVARDGVLNGHGVCVSPGQVQVVHSAMPIIIGWNIARSSQLCRNPAFFLVNGLLVRLVSHSWLAGLGRNAGPRITREFYLNQQPAISPVDFDWHLNYKTRRCSCQSLTKRTSYSTSRSKEHSSHSSPTTLSPTKHAQD